MILKSAKRFCATVACVLPLIVTTGCATSGKTPCPILSNDPAFKHPTEPIDRITVPKGALPTIRYFRATPSSVDVDKQIRLQWDLVNATAAEITDNNGATWHVSSQQDYQFLLAEDTAKYRLIASNQYGSVTEDASVVVTPVIKSFVGDPKVVTRGQSALLEWETAGVTTVMINSTQQKDVRRGRLWVRPEKRTSYNLEAKGPDGTSKTLEVIVDVKPANDIAIVNFGASLCRVPLGGETELYWKTRNATKVTISPHIGDVEPEGRRSVKVQAGQTYTLTAESLEGRVASQITVNVEGDSGPIAPETDIVKFAIGDVRLTDEAKRTLDGVARLLLEAGPGSRVLINGHCDDRGSNLYNFRLGGMRALAIRDYLVSRGVSKKSVRTASYGKTQPVREGNVEEAWSVNRRGEIVIEKSR